MGERTKRMLDDYYLYVPKIWKYQSLILVVFVWWAAAGVLREIPALTIRYCRLGTHRSLTCAIVLFIIIALLFSCESYDFYYFVEMGRFTEN